MIKYPPPAFAWGVMASPQLPWWLWWWLVGDAALSRLHERVVVWWGTQPSRVCTRGGWFGGGHGPLAFGREGGGGGWGVTWPSRVCTRGWWLWLVGDAATSRSRVVVVVVVG